MLANLSAGSWDATGRQLVLRTADYGLHYRVYRVLGDVHLLRASGPLIREPLVVCRIIFLPLRVLSFLLSKKALLPFGRSFTTLQLDCFASITRNWHRATPIVPSCPLASPHAKILVFQIIPCFSGAQFVPRHPIFLNRS